MNDSLPFPQQYLSDNVSYERTFPNIHALVSSEDLYFCIHSAPPSTKL